MKKCLFALLMAHLPAAAEIPYGVEFVAGVRSNYLDDGEVIADDLIELQLQSQVSLTKTSDLTLALWSGTESSGEFQELAALIGWSKAFDHFELTSEFVYQSYHNTEQESGLEFFVSAAIPVSDSLELLAGVGYDFQGEAAFGEVGIAGSWKVTDASFVEAVGTFTFRDEADPLYLFNSRLSYTTNLTEMVSVTPFLGSSSRVSYDAQTHFTGGVWLEFFF